jgi:hypothetical protein
MLPSEDIPSSLKGPGERLGRRAYPSEVPLLLKTRQLSYDPWRQRRSGICLRLLGPGWWGLMIGTLQIR